MVAEKPPLPGIVQQRSLLSHFNRSQTISFEGVGALQLTQGRPRTGCYKLKAVPVGGGAPIVLVRYHAAAGVPYERASEDLRDRLAAATGWAAPPTDSPGGCR